MPNAKMGNTLPKKIIDSTIQPAVLAAIKQEHLGINCPIKSIANITEIPVNVIAKWYKGKHTPNAAHLLTLARYYPSVLETILTLIDRHDLWQFAVQEKIPELMREVLADSYFKYRKRGDILSAEKVQKPDFLPNKRQKWFLEMLKTEQKMQNKHIAKRWGVEPRTAKRDTAQLIEHGYIHSVRAGGTGWYEKAL